MIKGFIDWKWRSRTKSSGVQKVRKKSRFKVVFIGNRFWQRSVAGPLKSRSVPLILRGPPLIIKGAAQLKRPETLSFSGESLFGKKTNWFWLNIWNHIFSMIKTFFFITKSVFQKYIICLYNLNKLCIS